MKLTIIPVLTSCRTLSRHWGKISQNLALISSAVGSGRSSPGLTSFANFACRRMFGQALDPIDDEVADIAVHPLQVPAGLPIHRDAERVHAQGLCLPQRCLGVL